MAMPSAARTELRSPLQEDVDVVIVGLGPGGEALAARLAGAGLDVVAVERRLVGGECPYFACVPTKMMVRASDSLAEARRVARLAGRVDIHPDWAPVAARIRDQATDGWDDSVAARRITDAGARLVRGQGKLTGPHEVSVATASGPARFRARRAIVLNPGTDPALPGVEGLAATPAWTNRDIVKIASVPESLTVLGGGPVGCELAQVFSRFGCDVSVVEAAPRLLPNEEPEIGNLLAQVFADEHIHVYTSARATRVDHDGTRFTLRLDDGSTSGHSLSSERLLVATGRRVDLMGLGVAAIGLDEQGRATAVDEWMRAAEGVWAIGDVTGHGAFTHMSMYQARIAGDDILGCRGEPADYRAVPRVTFTDPEISAVGQSEASAHAQGLAVRTGITAIPESTRGWIHHVGNTGLIKLVVDDDRGVLVGATCMGPSGGEILGMLTLAVHAAIPITRLQQMIYAYPTFHRAVQTALDGLGPSNR